MTKQIGFILSKSENLVSNRRAGTYTFTYTDPALHINPIWSFTPCPIQERAEREERQRIEVAERAERERIQAEERQRAEAERVERERVQAEQVARIREEICGFSQMPIDLYLHFGRNPIRDVKNLIQNGYNLDFTLRTANDFGRIFVKYTSKPTSAEFKKVQRVFPKNVNKERLFHKFN